MLSEGAATTESRLRTGSIREDRLGNAVLYRYLSPTDNLERLTELLHEAYASLAAAGMRFVASHQDVDTTRRRAAKGETIVAVVDRAVIGTVTLATFQNTGGSPFYDRPDVMSIGQFAVTPSLQRRGIGTTLLALAERRAAEQGASHVALDTSEHAADLIRFYERHGYQFVEHLRWGGVNYRSVLMAKAVTIRAEPA